MRFEWQACYPSLYYVTNAWVLSQAKFLYMMSWNWQDQIHGSGSFLWLTWWLNMKLETKQAAPPNLPLVGREHFLRSPSKRPKHHRHETSACCCLRQDSHLFLHTEWHVVIGLKTAWIPPQVGKRLKSTPTRPRSCFMRTAQSLSKACSVTGRSKSYHSRHKSRRAAS